jgi:hypothetical protein
METAPLDISLYKQALIVLAVSVSIAASPNKAGSSGRVSVMAFSRACEGGTIS